MGTSIWMTLRYARYGIPVSYLLYAFIFDVKVVTTLIVDKPLLTKSAKQHLTDEAEILQKN